MGIILHRVNHSYGVKDSDYTINYSHLLTKSWKTFHPHATD